MNKIIIDTCYWYALYDSRDPYHNEANQLAEYLELGKIIMPFPTLYETINTRFTKRKEWMFEFESVIKRENVILIDDSDYKNEALNLSFKSTLLQNRPISLVDTIIRLMLDDSKLNIDYLMSFNIGDFNDICQKNRIEIIN